MDMNQYMEVFIDETRENLQNLNHSLLNLEKNPGDRKELDVIFRIAHTLKGMSATMGYKKMADLTHIMEDTLDGIRNGGLAVSARLMDVLFKCLDSLEEYLNNIINSSDEGERVNTELINELRYLNTNKTADEPDRIGTVNNDLGLNSYERSVIKTAHEKNLYSYKIDIQLDKGCLLKAARAFIVFKTLEEYSEIIKSRPSVQDIEDENFELDFSLIILTDKKEDYIRDGLLSISEMRKVTVTVINEDNSFESDNKKIPVTDDNAELKSDIESSGSVAKKTGKTVRVDIERLDVLLNLVSELIIQKTRIEELGGIDKSQQFSETVEYLERITTNLHDAVMKVRMVPLESVFNRFPRMIRDISRDIGKEINLVMSGQQTELDRTVIDEIGEPLIHLLRNAADHGLEVSEERAKHGKNTVGNIYLKAYQEGNSVVIEVRDDGKGFDIDKIKEIAVTRGFVKNRVEELSEEDVIELLFLPNFSTAEKVTGLSGRGVGLDVVKTKIQSLGGSIEVKSEKNKGTSFIIRMPLTLAIIQALLVVAGNEKYAIPISSINRIIEIKPEDIRFAHEKRVIIHNDMLIPVICLKEILGKKAESEVKKKLTAVIVKKGEKFYALIVDSLIGQQEIVIKPLGKYLIGIKLFAGATILGDGNVALIIDVNTLTMN